MSIPIMAKINMKQIKLNTNKGDIFTLLDDKDARELYGVKLWLSKKHVRFLVSENKEVLLHRWLMGEPEGLVVDHINGDSLDNRRSNLRVCTQMDNVRNKAKQSNNTSGVPGVEKHKTLSLWRVRIKYLGNKLHIGYFKSLEEAGYVRDQVILQLHGEFARTYVIDSKGSDFASCQKPSWYK